MKINNIHQNRTSFKARDFASIKTNVKGVITELKVLEIDEKDVKFLDLMSSKIDLLTFKQIKKATTKQIRNWKATIDNAILFAGFNEPQQSFLLAKENHACGIMTYKNNPQDTFLDYIATWPINENETIKLAGKSLIKLLYDNSIKNDTKIASLAIMNDSPSDLFTFYQELGLKKITSFGSNNADMYILKQQMIEESKKLEAMIQIEMHENSKFIDLKKTIDTKG